MALLAWVGPKNLHDAVRQVSMKHAKLLLRERNHLEERGATGGYPG